MAGFSDTGATGLMTAEKEKGSQVNASGYDMNDEKGRRCELEFNGVS
jgi:hypothetical protein